MNIKAKTTIITILSLGLAWGAMSVYLSQNDNCKPLKSPIKMQLGKVFKDDIWCKVDSYYYKRVD